MSSFIVSQDCMNNIINGLFWDYKLKDYYSRLYNDMGLIDSEDFELLAKKLYKLNQAGVMARYPTDKTGYAQIPLFEWKSGTPIKRLQLLKSLHCLRYQCDEGNTHKRKLFKWVSKVIEALQDLVIGELPEYDKAKWD